MAENVFNENQEYLVNAKKAIGDLNALRGKFEEIKTTAKKTRKAANSEEKSINDEINSTVKKRKDQIASTYDKAIDANNSKIKQVQSKKEKKKDQRMENRIKSETSGLREENRQLKATIKTIYKQNHVPSFCNSNLFYYLFAPKGIGEVFDLFLIIVLMCGCLPALVITALQKGKLGEGEHTLLFVIIVALIIILEFIIYVAIFNATKVKHRDTIIEGRRTRDKVKANEKAIKAIRNSIIKDKDESVYGLGKYDAKINELKGTTQSISDEKLAALKEFEQTTKQIIIDEINGRRLPKLEALRADADKADRQMTAMQNKIDQAQLDITNKYETYLGKDFCTEERLSDLIAIMDEGTALTVSDAIKVYKGDDI